MVITGVPLTVGLMRIPNYSTAIILEALQPEAQNQIG